MLMWVFGHGPGRAAQRAEKGEQRDESMAVRDATTPATIFFVLRRVEQLIQLFLDGRFQFPPGTEVLSQLYRDMTLAGLR